MYTQILDEVGMLYEADILWKAYKAFIEKHPRGNQEEKAVELSRSFFQSVVVLPIRSRKDIHN